MIERRFMLRSLLVLSAAGVFFALLFSLFPRIDIRVSGLFADQNGFVAPFEHGLDVVRDAAWNFSLLILFLVTIMLGLTSLRRLTGQRIATRVWGFAVLTYILAPGVMANVLLKNHWGRARPRSVTEFGGDLEFTPALQLADQCSRNCSFVSGEASGAVATAIVISILFAPTLGARGRWMMLVPLWAATMATSALRIIMGGHFLSDVIFAAIFTGIIAMVLALFLRLDQVPGTVTPGNIWRDFRDALTFARTSRKP